MANLNDIVSNPSSHFSAPSEVVDKDGLPLKMKEKILKNWEKDAQALQVATDEGMAGVNDDPLTDVSDAIVELEKEGPEAKGTK